MSTVAASKRWHRPVFLGVSAALFFGVVVAAHEVMLPFVFAIIIAYVLTPLVSAAFFHASIPPWMCRVAASPASRAACTAIAERSPKAQ